MTWYYYDIYQVNFFFVCFLGEVRKTKIAFEIIWPLGGAKDEHFSFFQMPCQLGLKPMAKQCIDLNKNNLYVCNKTNPMYNFITEYNLMNSRGTVKVIWAALSYFHLAPISMVQKLCTFIIPSLHCPCSFYLCVIYWSYRLQTLEHRNRSVFVTFFRIMNNNSAGKLVISMFFQTLKSYGTRKPRFCQRLQI